MNTVEIGLEGVKAPSWQNRVVPFIDKVLRFLGRDNWDLSVLFCGNSYMQSLNSRYRGLDEPTDVLSFSLGERSGDRYVPGDIVVSLDMLEENSRYFGVSRDEELRRLLIHGILHLDGMDHKGTGPGSFGGFPEEPMLKKQEEILERFSPEHIISEA